jgi:uncharacterized protein DUF4410/lipopolysaccharide assembly LptE-like protein
LKTLALLFFSLAWLLGGCASSATVKGGNPLAAPLSNYSTVLVRTTADTDWDHERQYLHTLVAGRLSGTLWFKRLWATPSADPNAADLIIQVRIVSVKDVSEGAREMFGSLAGRAHIVAEVRFTDVKAGKDLGAFEVDGKSSGTIVTATPLDEAIETAAQEIVREIGRRL